jgi:ABC-type polysaccharide/polyol phosphate transport system ATPase subunit
MVCTQIYKPDKGNVSVQGRVQLLALGVGFERQLSGRENVYIGGTLLGLKKTEIIKKMPEIEKFADIGDFIDEPVRTYSSGMKSRLAFAIATATNPDILILDEVMATGDRIFRKKAMDRMKNLQAMARCAMIISHSPGQLKKLCNKVVWLEKGQIVMYGGAQRVLHSYEEFCNDPDSWKNSNIKCFQKFQTV